MVLPKNRTMCSGPFPLHCFRCTAAACTTLVGIDVSRSWNTTAGHQGYPSNTNGYVSRGIIQTKSKVSHWLLPRLQSRPISSAPLAWWKITYLVSRALTVSVLAATSSNPVQIAPHHSHPACYRACLHFPQASVRDVDPGEFLRPYPRHSANHL